MTPNTILFLVLALYVLVVFLLGFYGYLKRNKSEIDDLYHGGRSFGWIMILLTIFASLYSAFSFIGFTGFFYAHGMSSIYLIGIEILFIAPLMYFVGRKMWRLSVEKKMYSPVEILTNKYHKSVAMLVGLVSVIFLIPTIAGQVIGIGKLLSTVSGGVLAYPVVVIGFVVIVLLYSRMGGMRTIIWTDALQSILMVGLLGILVYMLSGVVGFTSLFDSLREANPAYVSAPGLVGLWSYQMAISFAILFTFIPLSAAYISQRTIALKDESELKKAMMAFPALSVVVVLMIMYIGVSAIVLVPGLESGDLALPSVLNFFANPWLTGLVVIATVAAAMSSSDSILLAIDSILLRDFYKNIVKDKKKERLVSLVGITIAAGAVLVVSLYPPTLIITLGVLAFSGFLQLVPTFWGSLFWDKSTTQGALASIIGGIGTLITFQYFFTPLFGYSAAVMGFVVSIILFWLVSLITSKQSSN